jgi:hypothetical protein
MYVEEWEEEYSYRFEFDQAVLRFLRARGLYWLYFIPKRWQLRMQRPSLPDPIFYHFRWMVFMRPSPTPPPPLRAREFGGDEGWMTGNDWGPWTWEGGVGWQLGGKGDSRVHTGNMGLTLPPPPQPGRASQIKVGHIT